MERQELIDTITDFKTMISQFKTDDRYTSPNDKFSEYNDYLIAKVNG